MADLSIELQPVITAALQQQTTDVTDVTDTVETESERQEFSLPPVDHGKDAYLFLGACFTVEGLVWGFPFAFGVFQDYYSTHEPFAGSSNVAIIGTCAMGIMYLSGPLVTGFARLYPRLSRWWPLAGLIVMCLALALSSLSTTVTQLIATQGVLYAVGGAVAYYPCILYLDEWFVKRKGWAYGVMWAGTGLAGFVLPLLLSHLLTLYGFRTTLRIFAVTVFVVTAPLAYFVKPRLPPSATTHLQPLNMSFVMTRAFALYQLANVVEALGFFLPSIFLPSYARATLGASFFAPALTILLVNVASVFGCITMGLLVDRLHVTTCLFVSAVGATVGTFLFWGLAESLPLLYVFCIIQGIFAGSYTSAWPGIVRHITDASNDSRVDPTMVFAWLAAGRGIGNVASGPLSEALIKGMPWQGSAAAGYGSGYGTLIIFTGVTAFVSGTSFLWRRLGWL